jgi:hypothetical protein
MTRFRTSRIVWMALSGAVLAVVLGVAAPASAVPAAQSDSAGSTGPSITITPKSLDFGEQDVFTTSAPRTLTFTNTGSTQVQITDVGPSAATAEVFSLEWSETPVGAGCINAVLAPGASCAMSFAFTPVAVGTQPVVVEVFVLGDPQLVADAALFGKGTTPDAFVGAITLPSGVVQNGVTGGQPVPATVSLSNTLGGKCATFKEAITVHLSVGLSVGVPADAASVPSQVVVPAGQCSANFTITTAATAVQESVFIDASIPEPQAPRAENGLLQVPLNINP